MFNFICIYAIIGIVTYVVECLIVVINPDILYKGMTREEFIKMELAKLTYKSIFGVILAIVLWPIILVIYIFGLVVRSKI